MSERGNADVLGASVVDGGVSFRIYSAGADGVDLCLFDDADRQVAVAPLEAEPDGVWHTFRPGLGRGQRYGYRVRGPYDLARGQRYNANKLLIDPYALRLVGNFAWSDALLDANPLDSAAFVPKCVVDQPGEAAALAPRPRWADLVVYECNVRGYTMRHPDVPERDRGKFAGMSNGRILEYIKSLGITSIELMPVQAFIDERFLVRRGLRNFWGYNTINFFAPAGRLGDSDAVGEFRDMVRGIHDAGLEVIMDVAYNHTGESDTHGPTLSFRGIDNLSYYRTQPGHPGDYVNDTGCGNTLNTHHPRVQQLILDSLAYWVSAFGVDGFRFDLATTLGRGERAFERSSPLFAAMAERRELRHTRFFAEPWDVGPGGYQLGHFPAGWSEWNDRFRDDVRRYWRGDAVADQFARRLHGSADIFEHHGRPPLASTNMVTAHDGYTLADVVSYERRHNEANGEDNLDGHKENYSCNYGVEGPADDEAINALRRRQRLNMLGSLLLAQGTPMLLAGDEFGNSQSGNNNAYAQDNDIGWLDWSGLGRDPDFVERVRSLIALRREFPVFRQPVYRHDHNAIRWLSANGGHIEADRWPGTRAFMLLLRDDLSEGLLLFNASPDPVSFCPPAPSTGAPWDTLFDSAADDPLASESRLAAWSLRACASPR